MLTPCCQLFPSPYYLLTQALASTFCIEFIHAIFCPVVSFSFALIEVRTFAVCCVVDTVMQ